MLPNWIIKKILENELNKYKQEELLIEEEIYIKIPEPEIKEAPSIELF
jgi:hypothetical protein